MRSKFLQAHRHASTLAEHVANFLKSQPYEVYDTEEPESGDLVTRIKITREPPIELSLVLGDAVHNARAALDHLAWQLVLDNGGTPGKHTYFPTTGNLKSARSCLKGASTQVIDLVLNKIKPYPGGDDRFPLLHQLDIEDKHHAIVLVGAAHSYMNLHVTMKLPGKDHAPIEMPAIGIPPKDRQYPLMDGLEVGRIMKAARAESDLFSMRTSFTFDLCFSADSAPAGEPLIPTIPALIKEIEDEISPLIALLP